MSEAAQTALIAGAVALITAAIPATIAVGQFRRERLKWVQDLRQLFVVELYKERLAHYPKAHCILGRLSSASTTPLSVETARSVAQELNSWIYEIGGLIADAPTRAALFAVRDECIQWSGKESTTRLYANRNSLIDLLRLDLDLEGLDAADWRTAPRLTTRLQADG